MNKHINCDKTKFKPPVGWLMGRELLAGLKWIAAYSLMGTKQDPKDWMRAEVIEAPHQNNEMTGEPYWFDYIADTGDGMRAVYNIAYLCMSDLWVESGTQLGPDKVALKPDSTCTEHLPRGSFLFVGGDTAYHIADTASLKERFQTPFNCAASDIDPEQLEERRPIYGIPANHDYYDALDGFNRQFCRPIGQENKQSFSSDPKDPQLGLLGFERTQTASYVALKLPFDWRLWGLDSQGGEMDKRQQAFFISTFCPDLINNGELFDKNKTEQNAKTLSAKAPKKLIIATPEPSTVFGKWAKDDSSLVKTFKQLGLEPSFLKDKNGTLDEGKCRLDISGDIHHYERYWGSTDKDSAPTNYASVVAGGGGAFLHPSHTDVNALTRRQQYPSRADSHTTITRAILKPWNIFLGGYIWLVGGIIAFLSYFAVTIPQSTWSLFNLPESIRPPLEGGSLLSQIRKGLDTSNIAQITGFYGNEYCYDLLYILLFIAGLGFWLWRSRTTLNAAKNYDTFKWRKTIFLFMVPAVIGVIGLAWLIRTTREQLPHSFLAGSLIDGFSIAALLLFGLSRIYSDALLDRARYHRESRIRFFPSWVYEKLGIAPETSFEAIPLWSYNLLALCYVAFGFLRYGAYSASIMTFDLLIAVVWLLASVGLVLLALVLGAQLLSKAGKIKFTLIGTWHAILQLLLPVCLMVYSSWTTIAIIAVVGITVTLLSGRIFTAASLMKDFSLSDQTKIGSLLLGTWGVLGSCLLIASAWGDPIVVDGWRLAAAFVIGSLFSCIWFGWYLAVSLAFHGHNNEAGGGARSEQYRHMIRFKLTKTTLTGYVIGFDQPVTEISTENPPKFRLIDVFTIQAPK